MCNIGKILLCKSVNSNTSLHFGSNHKVVDKDPTKKEGEFEDLSSVEKYEMSTEDYSKRTGRSLRPLTI